MASSADSNAEPESPVSLGRFNLKAPRKKVQQTFFGKVRAFHTFTALEWSYLGFSFVGLTASAGLTIERIVTKGTSSSDFTFAILLLLTIAFCYYYVVDAVLTERADELLVFVVSNFIVLVYCIANYALQQKNTIKLVRMVVVCVLSLILIPAGLYQCWKYVRSNNLIFNTVGGVTQLQIGCKIYFVCSSLLKFDLQLQLSMLILVMGADGAYMDQTQKFILGYGVVFTVIFVIIGFVGLRQENRILMIVFYILGLGEPGYVAYKFYYSAKHESKDAATYESTFACGCFALAVWVALMIFTGYYTKYCFYKGLREKMFGYPEQEAPQQPPVAPSGIGDSADLASSSSTVQTVESSFLPPMSSLSTPPTALSVTAVEVHNTS